MIGKKQPIFHEDAVQTMLRMGKIVDVVLTSPPYNTSRKSSDAYNRRYDIFEDSKTDNEYLDWTVEKRFFNWSKLIPSPLSFTERTM